MGLFDTIECDYPLPNPRHQDLEFQTKDLDCLLDRYSITRDGRLLKHARGGLFEEGERAAIESDVELPMHGDLRMHDLDPDAEQGLVEYVVRFTHGRVEWIRRKENAKSLREGEATDVPAVAETRAEPRPSAMGRALTVEEFSAHTPEKLELVGGRIPGDKGLLLLILTSLGLRRAAALVGYDTWRTGLPEEGDGTPQEPEGLQ